MRKICSFLLILLFIFNKNIIAQKTTYSIKWGETSRSKILPTDYLGRDAKGNYIFYSARIKVIPLLFVTLIRKQDYFNVYDKDLDYQESIDMELPKLKASGYNMDAIGARSAIRIGNEAWLVQRMKDKDSYALQGWKLDFNKKKIGKAKTIGKIPDGKDLQGENALTAISTDSSKILIYFPTKTRGENKEGYYFFVLDKSFTKIWSGRGEIPYAADDYIKDEVTIDNQGFVTVTGKYYIPKKERKRGEPKWEPVILRYTEKGKPEKLTLNPKGKFVQNTFLSAGKSNQTMAVGFYGNDRASEQDGLFFAQVSANGQLEGTKTFEFDNDFLTSTMKENRATRIKNRMDDKDDDFSESNFRFKDMISTSDGGFLALGEQYSVSVNNNTLTSTRATQTISYSHFYGDIIAAKFSSDGELLWTKKLNHYYTITTGSRAAPFSRMYGFTTKGTDTFVVFEDDEKNLDNRDNRKMFELRRSVATVVAKIDALGKIERNNVETDEERSSWNLLMPSVTTIEQGKVLLTAYRGLTARKKKIGILTVKN
jgi:hypothetical protein